MLIFGLSSVIISSTGLPLADVLPLVAGSLGNVGLAFGTLGPTESFTVLAPLAKIVCIIHKLNISHKELTYLLQKSISYRNEVLRACS